LGTLVDDSVGHAVDEMMMGMARVLADGGGNTIIPRWSCRELRVADDCIAISSFTQHHNPANAAQFSTALGLSGE